MQKQNRFCSEVGIQYPIIQAPMAGVATPRLAAAVSNAGGLGSLGIGASDAESAKQRIEETRALTDQPFNVNVFCHEPAIRNQQAENAWLTHLSPLFAELDMAPPAKLNEIYKSFIEDDDVLEMLLSTKPAVVSFHFGLPPGETISALKKAGIYTIATATNPDEAHLIERSGVDAIVAQGIEAGGHRGVFNVDSRDEKLSTSVLTGKLAQACDLPIIAAGGIVDGMGIKAAMSLGADAAQLGTAFILCPESAASDDYRAALKSDRSLKTQLTSSISGRPARGIVNRLITHCQSLEDAIPASYPLAYDAAKKLHNAASIKGINEFAAYWSGQGAPIKRELPAEDLIRLLVKESGL
ncbi:nitronate monooxygenase [Alteromonas sp. NFXS44]|uniref:NAD(P)H-dependent flavin oxidoreductase n=1 Tax=Alteromonas sp. NFXS44 TaxID=2818435 RepID=UPI0032DED3AE